MGNYVEDAYNAAQRGYKIVMAEAGIAKQLLRGGAAYSYDEMGNVAVTVNSPSCHGTTAIPPAESLGRYDPNQDYYFKCGDYFLPLSFTYSVNAKNTRHRPSWWTDPSYSSGYTKSRRSYR